MVISTRGKAAFATLVLVLAAPLSAVSAEPAGALTYSTCYNVSGTPTFTIISKNSVQDQLKLKCNSARKVTIRARIRNVFCTLGVQLLCKTKYFQPWGTLGGSWKAGQTRTATWVHVCQGLWPTGADLVSQLSGANYGENSWSVDGGKHWSAWVGQSRFRLGGC